MNKSKSIGGNKKQILIGIEIEFTVDKRRGKFYMNQNKCRSFKTILTVYL
jgi:hypothetical protein